MAQDRPTIAAELRRRVMVEAGHRCAIPTCRHIEVDIHHIVPFEQCRKHEYENLIALCPNCHRRADRGEIDRKSLRLYKANLRRAWDKFTQVEIDILFELVKRPANQPASQCAQLPIFMELFIKRLLDANYVELSNPPHNVESRFGPQINFYLLVITEKGRQYVESLGLELDN